MDRMWLCFWILIVLFTGLFIYLAFPTFYSRRLAGKHRPLGFTSVHFSSLITPLLTVLAITTTFAAFIVQAQFNQFQTQKVESEKAEKIIFEFINMHNDLVNSIEVTNETHGKKAFHYMYYEYITMRKIMDTLVLSHPELVSRTRKYYSEARLKNELTMITFRSFFTGISMTKNTALKNWVGTEFNHRYDSLLEVFRLKINGLKEMNEQRLYYMNAAQYGKQYLDSLAKIRNELMSRTRFMTEYFSTDQKFLFVDGHMPTLDVHMRLLKTILTRFNEFELSAGEKKYYLNLLRSQLSSHELLITALYGFSDRNCDWFHEGFFSSKVGVCNNLLCNIDQSLIEQSVDEWHRYVHGNRLHLPRIKVDTTNCAPRWYCETTWLKPIPQSDYVTTLR